MNAREYFKGVKTEAKKVHWPTKKETVKGTIIVAAVCTVTAVFLWAINSGVLLGMRALMS